ncbi:MAG: four helix bundle protein [Candidatus Bipolaricaulis sp.]|nr:four helix bundle protein [Candidatus Thermoplasmatota archaeon]MDY0392064.1 four helix bundle protein [Candidatus Bipolaricaulis sp.]
MSELGGEREVMEDQAKLGPESLRTLDVWQEGTQLVKQIYILTRGWPAEEMYGLTSQARRAAVSVPCNLAEGVGRGTPRERCRFAQTAIRSLYELDTLLLLAEDLGYSGSGAIQDVRQSITVLVRRVWAYIRFHRGRQ